MSNPKQNKKTQYRFVLNGPVSLSFDLELPGEADFEKAVEEAHEALQEYVTGRLSINAWPVTYITLYIDIEKITAQNIISHTTWNEPLTSTSGPTVPDTKTDSAAGAA